MLRPPGTERGTRRRSAHLRGGGFTIVELLITIGVVILLLSILLVALGQAMKGAQSANTRFLMTSMKQGLVRFKEDIGYYPPILNAGRNLDAFDPSWLNSESEYRDEMPFWGSMTSLPEYLLGVGHHYEDGYGVVPSTFQCYSQGIREWSNESPSLGIRNPGRDGVWGATMNGDRSGSIFSRMRVGLGPQSLCNNYGSETAPFDVDQGKVYGPYLELTDPDLLATIDEEGVIRYPGTPGYDLTSPNQSAIIVDYWGTPVWYHRRPYPLGGLRQGYRRETGAMNHLPTLSDVFYLRPFSIEDGAEIDGLLDFSSSVGGDPDPSTTYEVNSAEFALFSAGPDTFFERTMRVDPDGFNADNIVELGP